MCGAGCRAAWGRAAAGGGGAATWEGAQLRSDASDVCVVLRVERSSRRSSSRPALSSRGGAPWGEEECHMPSRLNPNCVGVPGRGAEVLREVRSGGGAQGWPRGWRKRGQPRAVACPGSRPHSGRRCHECTRAGLCRGRCRGSEASGWSAMRGGRRRRCEAWGVHSRGKQRR